MNAHTPTEATPAPLIHVAATHAAADRARNALERLRMADFDAGLAKDFRLTTERHGNTIASEVTAAVAELVTLALGIDKEETR